MNILDAIKDYPDAFFAFLDHSNTTIALLTDERHIIAACNENLARKLYITEKPIGRCLEDVFCPPEDAAPLDLVFSRLPGTLLPQTIKICYTETVYRCYAFETDGGLLLLGDQIGITENEVLENLSLLNNEMSRLSRELSMKNRELAAANQKINELARTDGLTGIANRRYFQERYEEAFSLAQRNALPLSVVMMDLDYFKNVNDTYGHDAGDRVLQAIAGLLKEHGRHEDMPARYGGEEFIVMMPLTAIKGAVAFAERVRKALSDMDILENGHKITLSGGVSEFQPGDSAQGLAKRADEALYLAKNQGRNQCIPLTDPPPS